MKVKPTSVTKLGIELMPLILILFFSSYSIRQDIFERFGLPGEPFIEIVWNHLYLTEMPTYIVEIGQLYILVSVVLAVVSMIFTGDHILGQNGKYPIVTREELGFIFTYAAATMVFVYLLDYSVTQILIIQGAIVLTFESILVLAPSVTRDLIGFPEQLNTAGERLAMTIAIFAVSFLMLVLAVVALGLVECGLSPEYTCF